MKLTEEVIDNAHSEVERLVHEKWRSFPDLRLLIITPSRWLRVHDGNLNGQKEPLGEFFLERLLSRGDILDYFSKVESLVREIIQARVLGLFSKRVQQFGKNLQKLVFNGCIRLLEEWGMMGGSLKDKIDGLNGVRNQE